MRFLPIAVRRSPTACRRCRIQPGVRRRHRVDLRVDERRRHSRGARRGHRRFGGGAREVPRQEALPAGDVFGPGVLRRNGHPEPPHDRRRRGDAGGRADRVHGLGLGLPESPVVVPTSVAGRSGDRPGSPRRAAPARVRRGSRVRRAHLARRDRELAAGLLAAVTLRARFHRVVHALADPLADALRRLARLPAPTNPGRRAGRPALRRRRPSARPPS